MNRKEFNDTIDQYKSRLETISSPEKYLNALEIAQSEFDAGKKVQARRRLDSVGEYLDTANDEVQDDLLPPEIKTNRGGVTRQGRESDKEFLMSRITGALTNIKEVERIKRFVLGRLQDDESKQNFLQDIEDSKNLILGFLANHSSYTRIRPVLNSIHSTIDLRLRRKAEMVKTNQLEVWKDGIESTDYVSPSSIQPSSKLDREELDSILRQFDGLGFYDDPQMELHEGTLRGVLRKSFYG